MVKDTKLYTLLGVSPTADEAELKKGYRKAALKYHPDKPTGNEEKFKEVSEAYGILSDKNKRALYDQHGLDAARSGQAPMPDFGGAGGAGGFPGGSAGFGGAGGFPGGSGGSTFSFGGPGGGSSGFSTSDAFNIFEMFGGMGGGMGGGGMGGSRMGGMDDSDDMFGGMGGMPGGFPGGSSRRNGRKSARTAPVDPKKFTLPVTMEQLYTGGTRKMKVHRRGSAGQVEELVLEVNLKPGWKYGTKITFAGKGDYQPDGTPQDIVFQLDPKESEGSVFTREGDDLRLKVKISFKESMLGFTRIIKTLDGKRLQVSQQRPTRPGTVIPFPDRGMPITKSPGKFGKLLIEINAEFPSTLSAAQRQAVEDNF